MKALINQVIAHIDKQLSRQLDEVYANQQFQALHATWLSLQRLTESYKPTSCLRLKILACARDDLQRDCQLPGDTDERDLFQLIVNEGIGHPGGEPFALLIVDYAFAPMVNQQAYDDYACLQELSRIGAAAFAPVVTALSAKYFAQDTFQVVRQIQDLAATISAFNQQRWQRFRQQVDARFLCLLLPGIILQDACSVKTSKASFAYQQDHRYRLIGNPAYYCAQQIMASYADRQWFSQVVNMPDNENQDIEATFNRQTCAYLRRQGMQVLSLLRLTKHRQFLSLQSCYRDHEYSLPELLIANRFLQAIKIMMRDKIGGMQNAASLEKHISQWLQQYCVQLEELSASQKALYPLREFQVSITPKPHYYAQYHCSVELCLHQRKPISKTRLQFSMDI